MWEINSHNQLNTFLWSILIGMLCCLLYDIIRAFRKANHTSIFMITIGDILLWILYAFITFIFLMVRTNGEIRAYVLLGELLGFILFRVSLSKFIFAFLYFVFLKIVLVKNKMYSIFDDIYAKFDLIISKTCKYVYKMLKRIKKLLKNTSKLLYTKQNIYEKEKAIDETNAQA